MNFFLFFLFLFGCASISEKDCLETDWKLLGQKDARAGEVDRTSFDERVNSCSRYSVTGDQRAYVEGYKEGLKYYCSYENSLNVGELGQTYSKICPEEMREKLNKGYLAGLKKYCTFETGYKLGLTGKGYSEVCPSDLTEKFLQGHAQGTMINEQKKLRQERERVRSSFGRRTFLGGGACRWNSDCVRRGQCMLSQGVCLGSGKRCSFDSNCDQRGQCESRRCRF